MHEQIRLDGTHARACAMALAALATILFLQAFAGTPNAYARTDSGETKTVEFVAVGDDLIHTKVFRAAKTSSGYDFNPMFSKVKEEIESADLAAINQETIFVKSGFSGYPSFGSPKKVGDAIVDTGFDIVTCATNHVMDRGSGAVSYTWKYWKKKHPEIQLLGIHDTAADARKIRIVKKNGIKIALLNYTYGLNGYSLPYAKKYLVDMLTSSNKAKIKRDIKRAKKKSDFVIVFPHWGTEYRLSADSSQKSWARFFANQGVDLVVGTHPHVVEPLKKVTGSSGNKMTCFYSLGNFVSNQYFSAETLLGGMAHVTIVKDDKGTRIKKSSLEALVTHIGSGSKTYRTYKLSDYTPALARANNIHRLAPAETFTIEKLKSIFKRASK